MYNFLTLVIREVYTLENLANHLRTSGIVVMTDLLKLTGLLIVLGVLFIFFANRVTDKQNFSRRNTREYLTNHLWPLKVVAMKDRSVSEYG